MKTFDIKLDTHDILKIKHFDKILHENKRNLTEQEMETLKEHQMQMYWRIAKEVRKYE